MKHIMRIKLNIKLHKTRFQPQKKIIDGICDENFMN